MASSNNLLTRARLAWQVLQGKALTPASPVTHTAAALALNKTLDEFFTDENNWSATSGRNPRDKTASQVKEDLSNALSAWRTNPLARRIVNLTRDHVWGNGIAVGSKNGIVDKWLKKFWRHPMNNMNKRLPLWIDALTLDGEVFPTFHTSPTDGMTYMRALAAIQVEDIQWAENDYEQLTRIGQRVENDSQLVYWPSILTAAPTQSAIWQYAINRPLGAIRGDGDLTPALPWLAYYSDWLASRANRGNVLSNFYYDITVKDATEVEAAKRRYASPPASGTAVVHSSGEEHKVQQPSIGAEDARADGEALRLMIAVAGNVPIHWLSETGQGNSEATSNNMNDVSYRFYATRQRDIQDMIEHVCTVAYRRAVALGHVRHFPDPAIFTTPGDISKNDNLRLSQSARDIAQTFALVLQNNLDAEPIIIKLIYKFAGEHLSESEINKIVEEAKKRIASQPAQPQAQPPKQPISTPSEDTGQVQEKP